MPGPGNINNSTLVNPTRGASVTPSNTTVNTIVPPSYNDLFDKSCTPVYVREQHITVIRRGPTMPPSLEMHSWDIDNEEIIDTNVSGNIVLSEDLYSSNMQFRYNSGNNSVVQNTPIGGGNALSCFYNSNKELKMVDDDIFIHIDFTGGPRSIDLEEGYKVVIKHNYTNSLGVTQTASVRGYVKIVATHPSQQGSGWIASGAVITLTSTPFNFPLTLNGNQIYNLSVIKKDPIFEFKFPRFAYRYRYEDGEYSVFSPWSEIAFIPGKFDYLPKKGYNLGMINNLRSLKILNWRPKNIPRDVVEIDLLYKESNSPNVYTVETFEIGKNPDIGLAQNKPGTGTHLGNYTITTELIHKVVPSNQMLRPWDNVPRVALGQEITANRLIYANYLQNYNLFDDKDDYIEPAFLVSVNEVDHSTDAATYVASALTTSRGGFTNQPKYPMKSLKSMRTYQLGIVYRDRYGRETPVLTNKSGSIKIEKSSAKLSSRLAVEMQSPSPDWAESYTFYIKETSNEYYNLSMDRWYDAEDGGIWLSFPSSERNKVKEGGTIILKKQHGNDKPVDFDAKYKILDIKNNAPLFIKEETQYWGVIPMMLPPPGWGVGDRVGGWDSGMFHSTGLPLPDRLYLDIYAEYFDQSILAGLTSKDNAEVRMVQSESTPSSYNAWSSSSINKSNWYGVANVNYIGAPAETYTETTEVNGVDVEQEIEVPGQAEQLVRISLEKLMGQDMAFCEPKDDLSLARGLSLEARTKTRRDNARFEGRFFVKIHRDSVATTNIIEPQAKTSEKYQVLMAKEIKYLCFAHPGVQDWRTDKSGTVGDAQATKGRWYQGCIDCADTYLDSLNVNYNYLPPAFDPAIDNNAGPPFADPQIAQTGTHPFWKDHHGGYEFPFGHRKHEVSSFSSTVGNATFTGIFPIHGNGGSISDQSAQSYPTDPYNWPTGPSWHASSVYSSNSIFPTYASTYQGYAYGDGNIVPKWPVVAQNNYGWPSFAPDHWAPNTTIDTSWVPGTTWDTGGTTSFGGPSGGPHIQHGANWNAGLLIINHGGVPNAACMKEIPPANPYQIPAIWGDQRDLYNNRSSNWDTYIGNPSAGLAITDDQNASEWSKDTIQKLRHNWRMLYYGRNLVSSTWPPGHASTERWFFDKVGAAKGYSGNGIWEEDGVTKMHISFYGIGQKDHRHRSHEMITHQENEIPFAEALATVGTQFRFRSDPDEVIYTITSASEPELIYNYEAPRGTWGWEKDGTTVGGAGIGEGLLPPFGPTYLGGHGGVAGKQAFISDIFTDYAKVHEVLTGGSLYNYRLRITLTLDKIIGDVVNGNSGFHPLTKHVDGNGDCNIEMGPKVYWSGNGTQAAPSHWKGGYHPAEKDGGTVEPVAFYNLSSYWNYESVTAPTTNQSKLATNLGTGQHFGLHEAGLNGTYIEIVTPYRGEDVEDTFSNNPAIWETEPMEDVGLDIYYAASPTYPINLRRWRSDRLIPDSIDYHWDPNTTLETQSYLHDYGWRGEEIIPVGAIIEAYPTGSGVAVLVAIQGETIYFDQPLKYAGSTPIELAPSDMLKISWDGEGAFYGGKKDKEYIIVTVAESIDIFRAKLNRDSHWGTKHTLPYFNCYTYSNGVESNRIKDDYNAVTIDKGVKASMPLAEKYMEERRGSSLIFSGIYNSTSGVNRLNQFIQAEPITKDINPINGTIQKLFARDTDLVTFCENKVFKILANKDALFNAGGNTNLTATNRVLGQTVPFVGEYGISKNPESFASESYRVYFTDKTRGAVLRLSRDGLTPISDYGMKDWFKDNFKEANNIIGSYNDNKKHYNITLETVDNKTKTPKAYTLSYSEQKRGWESFKSFLHQGGISYKNVYYTAPYNKIFSIGNNTPLNNITDTWGIDYYLPFDSIAQLYQHNLDLITEGKYATSPVYNDNEISFANSNIGEILIGMNIEGNGIPYGTVVESVDNNTNRIQTSNNIFISTNDELTFTMPRNVFYQGNLSDIIPPHYSMLKVLFNDDPGSVKNYKTLNYEGDQAKVSSNTGMHSNEYELHDGPILTGTAFQFEKYIDNWDKEGWYVENLFTDMQEGALQEFLDKENKWYNYIRGDEDANSGDEFDSKEFSAQGLGWII